MTSIYTQSKIIYDKISTNLTSLISLFSSSENLDILNLKEITNHILDLSIYHIKRSKYTFSDYLPLLMNEEEHLKISIFLIRLAFKRNFNFEVKIPYSSVIDNLHALKRLLKLTQLCWFSKKLIKDISIFFDNNNTHSISSIPFDLIIKTPKTELVLIGDENKIKEDPFGYRYDVLRGRPDLYEAYQKMRKKIIEGDLTDVIQKNEDKKIFYYIKKTFTDDF